MEPIKFEFSNVVFAEHQEEYLSLPAHKDKEGTVTTCWKLTVFERIKLLFTGVLYLQTLTFNNALQPQLLQTANPLTRLEVGDV